MKIINFPLLDCVSEQEFRDVFEKEFVKKEMLFRGYPVLIIRDDFDHIFFEKDTGGVEKGKFGVRRAKRMFVIRAICDETIPYVLLWEKEREDKELCVLCEQAETAIYLKARQSNGKKFFVLKTLIAFGVKVESKIKKQKMSEEIKSLDILFEEAD